MARMWLCLALLMVCVGARGTAVEDAAFADPEAASGYQSKQEVRASRYMMGTANPLATEAGHAMLEKGGSALDAAIAAQMVLTLVEPQSSGIGGGAFLVYYDRNGRILSAFDGRETAPAAARPDRFLRDGEPLSYRNAVDSGLSVGVPGLLRMLELAHRRYGKLPWPALFEPAIRLAEEGFPVSPRLHALIQGSAGLAQQKAAADYFLDGKGRPWPVGHILRNPALADVLRAVAEQGADAFYTGDIARAIVAAVHAHPTPGDMTLRDLSDYEARIRQPLCGPYRVYRICGVPAPSSGTIGVLELLGVLQYFPVSSYAPAGLEAVHYFSEAGRLAYADRDHYVADPDFVDVPTEALLDPAYLQARAALIQPDRSMGRAQPGDPLGTLSGFGRDNALELPSTSHIVAVDDSGDVLSMTSSIEAAFGSKIFVRGFLLNNELTDFSWNPVDEDGRPVANRVEPGKRPRSAMAPLIIFREGRPYMALGSPGGSAIINYVAKTVVGVLDWSLDIQQAIALPNFGSRNRETELEAGSVVDRLAEPLRAMGHTVLTKPMTSGVQGIVIDENGLHGGADPRREGLIMGDGP